MKVLTDMREQPVRRDPVPQVRLVSVKPVVPTVVSADISAFGRVVSGRPVEIVSEVPGTLLQGDIRFQPAAQFRKGDLLIRVDDRQARLDLNSIKSDLMNALATVLPEIKVDFPEEFTVWQEYFNRCRFNGRLPDLPDTDNQKIKLFLARFNVYKLYFAARNQEIHIQKHYFRAPFDGVIVEADLRTGSTVRAGTRLGRIISLDELEVEVPLPARDLQYIHREKPVRLTSGEVNREWSGRIARIGGVISERTETVSVFIEIDSAAGSGPLEGVFVTAHIPGKPISNAVEIPLNILYGKNFVYVVEDGKLQSRSVEIARENADSVIISDGLDPGDLIVVDILQGVSPGMSVETRIIEEV